MKPFNRVNEADLAFFESLLPGRVFSGEAISTDIVVDKAEMDDCRWFTRDEVKAMLATTEVGKLHCPPRLAVARHLIEVWADLK